MSKMIFVIDTSSLINLGKYFIFGKKDLKEEYEKFRNFFKNKFLTKEFIIIDKVDKEHIGWIKEEFDFSDNLIESTEDNSENLNLIVNDKRNINKNFSIDKDIESEKNYQKKEKADLSLVAYCKKVKEENKEVCLITDETEKEKGNKKLYKKIPNMCSNYNITCKNLSYLIFIYYKNQIKFKIEVQ